MCGSKLLLNDPNPQVEFKKEKCNSVKGQEVAARKLSNDKV